MAKLTVEQIKEIVSAITYKPDWHIHLKDDGERLYVQIEATTLDSITKQPCTWKSGKTYLSPFMCRQEVVGAVFGAIEKAEIHEMREFFRYKGASIYNPHLDPDVLVEVAKKKESFNVRDNAMDMVEESSQESKKIDATKDSFSFTVKGMGKTFKAQPSDDNYVLVQWVGMDGTLTGTPYHVSIVQKAVDTGEWTVVE